jgi:hypothetical protein
MKKYIFTLCLLFAFTAPSFNFVQAREQRADIVYSGPLVITKGGTYTGNYRSTDSKTPAVWIWTEEPVTITGCNIQAAGNGIHFGGHGNATVTYNNIFGITPSGSENKGRAIYCYQPESVIAEHNTIENTGGGVFLDQFDPSRPPKKVLIRYNSLKNMDKRKADQNDLSNGQSHMAGIMLSDQRGLGGAEIAWNQIINEPGKSWTEDCINMFNSGGTSSSHLVIHDNYIFGAYPWPVSSDKFSGSGITVDGDPGHNTFETVSQYIDVYSNQVLSTCNALMNIAAGHDIKYYGNTMISAGKYPDGSPGGFFWGGFCIWDASNVGPGVFVNNSIENNTVAYVRPGVNNPFPNRQDYVRDSKTPAYVDYTKNAFLPNPITVATEQAELPKWQKKLSDNKIAIGNTTAPVTAPTGPIPTTDPGTLNFKVGQSITGKITPVTATGATASFKAGTVKVVSSAATKLLALKNGTDETEFTLTPKAAGSSKLTVSFTSTGGKVISKVYKVAVATTTSADEAVGMNIQFTVK